LALFFLMSVVEIRLLHPTSDDGDARKRQAHRPGLTVR
jgi:hypothetical protein